MTEIDEMSNIIKKHSKRPTMREIIEKSDEGVADTRGSMGKDGGTNIDEMMDDLASLQELRAKGSTLNYIGD